MDLLTDLLPSKPDARDHIASIQVPSVLPPSVDLKPHVFEVEDQGVLGTCTANSGCSALELMYNKKGTPVDLSRLFAYWHARKLGNLTGDSGAYPRDLCKALNQYGVCYEKSWTYHVSNLEKEPTPEVTKEAEEFKIVSYERITGDVLPQIKTSLAQGIPVLLTIQVHSGFEKLSGPWKQHSWDWITSEKNPVSGYHAVLIIGYDDTAERLLVENSWGPYWADGGFFGIPYDMLSTPAFGELWILNPNYDIKWSPEKIETEKQSNTVLIIGMIILAAFLYFVLLG